MLPAKVVFTAIRRLIARAALALNTRGRCDGSSSQFICAGNVSFSVCVASSSSARRGPTPGQRDACARDIFRLATNCTIPLAESTRHDSPLMRGPLAPVTSILLVPLNDSNHGINNCEKCSVRRGAERRGVRFGMPRSPPCISPESSCWRGRGEGSSAPIQNNAVFEARLNRRRNCRVGWVACTT